MRYCRVARRCVALVAALGVLTVLLLLGAPPTAPPRRYIPPSQVKIKGSVPAFAREGSGKPVWKKPTPDRDSNLDPPVISSLVHCESSALDDAATETCPIVLLGTESTAPALACALRFKSVETSVVEGLCVAAPPPNSPSPEVTAVNLTPAFLLYTSSAPERRGVRGGYKQYPIFFFMTKNFGREAQLGLPLFC
uniref:Uncharacterized protein n=1 Tax=Timema tahoe TaxID=61484 RepID=A0A7R9P185_9NEOP|nr:unnamed protein product [Timema tahoe]